VAYPEIFKQVVYTRFNVERVQPKRKYSCFPFAFSIEIFNVSRRRWSFLGSLKAGDSIEEIGDKSEIKLWITSDHSLVREELSAVDFIGIVENLGGSF
jgi:hypothetical protein